MYKYEFWELALTFRITNNKDELIGHCYSRDKAALVVELLNLASAETKQPVPSEDEVHRLLSI